MPPQLLSCGGFFYFDSNYRYNKSMNNEKYNAPNSPCCGRPINYAPANKCNYNDSCLHEYCGAMPACIRNKKPDCMAKAVIPAVTVDTVDGLTNTANCFVHVTSTNTTYYVDDKHRPMIIWAGPVETTVPEDVQTQEQFEEFIKSFGLRSQYLYVKVHDNDNNRDIYQAFFFDKTGTGYYYGELYPIGNGGLI